MKKTKFIAFSAMMASLGVAILFLGSLVEVMDLTAVIIASLCVFVCAEETGIKSLSVFGVTAILAFLIIPSKIIAVEYTLFGAYPVLKRLFEKIKKPFCLPVKLVYMAIAVVADVLILFFVFSSRDVWYIEAALCVLGIVAFFVYDVALSRLTLLYRLQLRHRLRIDRFFEN